MLDGYRLRKDLRRASFPVFVQFFVIKLLPVFVSAALSRMRNKMTMVLHS